MGVAIRTSSAVVHHHPKRIVIVTPPSLIRTCDAPQQLRSRTLSVAQQYRSRTITFTLPMSSVTQQHMMRIVVVILFSMLNNPAVPLPFLNCKTAGICNTISVHPSLFIIIPDVSSSLRHPRLSADAAHRINCAAEHYRWHSSITATSLIASAFVF